VPDNKLEAEICSVSDILKKEGLEIPSYQRPYKWSLKHVRQLVGDLIEHQEKEQYRIGTVIMHLGTDVLDIVDGQQRLVTLSLILNFLEGKCEKFLDQAYEDRLIEHTLSRSNLQNNYAAIKQSLKHVTDTNALATFIREKCECVVVTLGNISEAFQFFDSQNARGKSLEPYDLLKAYHLREMKEASVEEQIRCVDAWESKVENKKLKPLFDDYLYRIRKWLRHESALQFTKDDIDLFKGISLTNNQKSYPYMEEHRILDFFFESGMNNTVSVWDKHHYTYPFQVGQTLINGQRFFEYVNHYSDILDKVKAQEGELFTKLKNYPGSVRTGDKYVRNLFNAGMLCYLDRFGDESLEKAGMVCFIWAYEVRFANARVDKRTMDNKGYQHAFLRSIQHAVHPQDILSQRLGENTDLRSDKSTNRNRGLKVKDIYEEYTRYFGREI